MPNIPPPPGVEQSDEASVDRMTSAAPDMAAASPPRPALHVVPTDEDGALPITDAPTDAVPAAQVPAQAQPPSPMPHPGAPQEAPWPPRPAGPLPPTMPPRPDQAQPSTRLDASAAVPAPAPGPTHPSVPQHFPPQQHPAAPQQFPSLQHQVQQYPGAPQELPPLQHPAPQHPAPHHLTEPPHAHPVQQPPQAPAPAPLPPQPGPATQFPTGPQQFGPQNFEQGQPGAGLDSAMLLRKARRAPRSGWRRTVHRMSGGTINPGDSQRTLHYDELVRQVNAPVRGDFRIAVLSLKGGVGKTTTTVGLGSTFADLRGDRVIAVDANPDLGTLSQRVRLQTGSTVRDVLHDDSIFRYSDIRRHTSQAASRLEVLASERDPATAETFADQDYRNVMRILQRYYNIILTDCGTGLSHSAMSGVLDLAQELILVSTPALDGARSASATLDWLEAHGHGHLVSRAVVVLNGPRRSDVKIDLDQLAQHFLARTRAVQIIPYDDHLAEGAEVDLALLDKATRRAYVELAATAAQDFALTTEPDARFPQ
nr:MinD/ParA family protein [Gordonia rhizosphera]